MVGVSCNDKRSHAGIRQVFVRAFVRDVIGEKERTHTVVEKVIVVGLVSLGIVVLGVA